MRGKNEEIQERKTHLCHVVAPAVAVAVSRYVYDGLLPLLSLWSPLLHFFLRSRNTCHFYCTTEWELHLKLPTLHAV